MEPDSEKISKRKRINPALAILLSFLIIILIGSFLLVCPFSQANGQWGDYVDSLTTAVSATCVTGISTYEEGFANTLSFWGELFSIIMVQIGGLGFITILVFVVSMFKHRFRFDNMVYFTQIVGGTSFGGIIKLVRKIISIQLVVELIGFLLGLPVFIKMFPNDPGSACWYSIFHSISAFNNAGFDLFEGTSSLIGGLFATGGEPITGGLYYYFCSYIMILILVGGLSFIAIIEIFSFKRRPKQYTSFTKIALYMTLFIVVINSLLLFISDGFKGEGSISYFDCLFQTVSARTAGFMTYSQDNLSIAGKTISSMTMFIGGSPLSTAGGIKTTTIFIIIIAIFSFFKGRKITAFKREFSQKTVTKALALLVVSLIIVIVGFLAFTGFGFDPRYTYGEGPLALNTSQSMAYAYEVFSCFGTTGFFTGIEPYLSVGSKIIMCLLMFFGRLGPMTFFQIFEKNMEKDDNRKYKFVDDDVLIG